MVWTGLGHIEEGLATSDTWDRSVVCEEGWWEADARVRVKTAWNKWREGGRRLKKY